MARLDDLTDLVTMAAIGVGVYFAFKLISKSGGGGAPGAPGSVPGATAVTDPQLYYSDPLQWYSEVIQNGTPSTTDLLYAQSLGLTNSPGALDLSGGTPNQWQNNPLLNGPLGQQ